MKIKCDVTNIRVRVCSILCLFVTLWTVPCQASLSWSSPGKNTGVGCQALLQGNLPNPEIGPASLATPALQEDSLPISHLGSLCVTESVCVCT